MQIVYLCTAVSPLVTVRFEQKRHFWKGLDLPDNILKSQTDPLILSTRNDHLKIDKFWRFDSGQCRQTKITSTRPLLIKRLY